LVLLSFVSIGLIAIVYLPLKKLNESDNLYYGSEISFYHDTLISLVKYTMYSSFETPIVSGILNIFLILTVILVISTYLFSRKILTPKNIILFISVSIAIFVVFQHYLFGTLYIIDRSALFFYPLIILLISFSCNELPKKLYSKIILGFILLAFIVNFLSHINFYKTAIWYLDAHSKEILTKLNELGKKENRKIKIDYSWPFQNSIKYYMQNIHYSNIEIVKNPTNREDLNINFDYYIYFSYSLLKVHYEAQNQKILLVPKKEFSRYEKEGIIIFSNLRK